MASPGGTLMKLCFIRYHLLRKCSQIHKKVFMKQAFNRLFYKSSTAFKDYMLKFESSILAQDERWRRA
jgi:hypothetical protein